MMFICSNFTRKTFENAKSIFGDVHVLIEDMAHYSGGHNPEGRFRCTLLAEEGSVAIARCSCTQEEARMYLQLATILKMSSSWLD
jgi:hypothetical protein